mmetsp:Transcript_6552/g.7931  ORF Transcript_6552/g.7931 Transcript_6552/m.7931 type:complete len:408 (-) Transcript_6552:246-1469(-)
MSFPYSGGDATAPAQAQAIPVIPNPAGGLPTGDAVPVVATPVVATPVPGPVYATPVNADPVVPQVNPYVPPPGVSFNSGYVNAQPVNAVPAYGPGAANLSLPQTVQAAAPVTQQMHPGAAVVQPAHQVDAKLGGYSFVQGRKQFLVKQHFEALEAAASTAGCGCIEFENKYDVFDLNSGEPVLFVKEQSDWFCRCCCAPNHRATLNVYDVRPGAPPDKIAMVVEKPFKLNCIVCHNICAHEHKTKLENGTVVGGAAKTIPFGGGCSPKLEVKNGNEESFAIINGPCCCVGGLVELCQDIHFDIEDPNSKEKLGKITKKKPAGLEKFQEAFGDHDTFMLELAEKVTDDKVANFIATLLLMDYIFFEGGSPISYNPVDNSCQINCWNCYVLGCLCPCHCSCGGNNEVEG